MIKVFVRSHGRLELTKLEYVTPRDVCALSIGRHFYLDKKIYPYRKNSIRISSEEMLNILTKFNQYPSYIKTRNSLINYEWIDQILPEIEEDTRINVLYRKYDDVIVSIDSKFERLEYLMDYEEAILLKMSHQHDIKIIDIRPKAI